MPSPEPSRPAPVTVLDPAGEDYRRAFEVFLAFTDQKTAAAHYLADVIGRLPNRKVFVDAGAGRGDTTRWIAARFEHAIAVEPSTPMRAALRQACPGVRLLGTSIGCADIATRADLVLCAHVLYYVPVSDWTALTRRMLSWVAEDGELVLALQNPGSDCMRMVHAFTGVRYDLSALADQLGRDGARTVLDTVPATVHTRREADAVTIAEFMLNIAPLNQLRELPRRDDLQAYVRHRFADPADGFTFTCAQDFLRIRPHAGSKSPPRKDC